MRDYPFTVFKVVGNDAWNTYREGEEYCSKHLKLGAAEEKARHKAWQSGFVFRFVVKYKGDVIFQSD